MRKYLCIACIAILVACSKGSGDSLPLPTAGPNGAASASRVTQLEGLFAERSAPDAYTSLYSFKGVPDGAYPMKRLLDVGGELYGTTYYGGAYDHRNGQPQQTGTVFKVNPSGSERVVYIFKGEPDGASPVASLIDVKGLYGGLYGTTYYGGARSRGSVFKVSPSGSESVLYSFTGAPDGRNPNGGLIEVSGEFYGTTREGGRRGCGGAGCGTVFSLSPSGSETVIYRFKPGADGNNPVANLLHMYGAFYGVTASGGTSGNGAVFQVSFEGAERILYSFKGPPDGSAPQGGLTYVNGAFYGTTTQGGTNLGGTVFKLSPSGSEKLLYSFGHRSAPEGGLNGYLYGTTAYGGGGTPGSGTVFKVSLSGKETVVYHFKGGTDGKNPTGGLINVNGTLYGTTSRGGSADMGTIFTVSP